MKAYYEQVHMALYGEYCARSLISDGVDVCEEGKSVSPELIKSLAGDLELEVELAKRERNTLNKDGVYFGVNKDLQHGLILDTDKSDGRTYVMHHPTGAFLKIKSSDLKSRCVPYPGLRDAKNAVVRKVNKLTIDLPPSAEWMKMRVFPQVVDYSICGIQLVECRTEKALYHGHDHVVHIRYEDLVF